MGNRSEASSEVVPIHRWRDAAHHRLGQFSKGLLQELRKVWGGMLRSLEEWYAEPGHGQLLGLSVQPHHPGAGLDDLPSILHVAALIGALKVCKDREIGIQSRSSLISARLVDGTQPGRRRTDRDRPSA